MAVPRNICHQNVPTTNNAQSLETGDTRYITGLVKSMIYIGGYSLFLYKCKAIYTDNIDRSHAVYTHLTDLARGCRL